MRTTLISCNFATFLCYSAFRLVAHTALSSRNEKTDYPPLVTLLNPMYLRSTGASEPWVQMVRRSHWDFSMGAKVSFAPIGILDKIIKLNVSLVFSQFFFRFTYLLKQIL